MFYLGQRNQGIGNVPIPCAGNIVRASLTGAGGMATLSRLRRLRPALVYP